MRGLNERRSAAEPRAAAVVDVHGHLYPRRYLDRLKQRADIPRVVGTAGQERFVIFPEERERDGGRRMSADYCDADSKLEWMDKWDRPRAPLGNPWLDPIPADESVWLARALNEEFAALEAMSKSRMLGFGVLPSGNVQAAVDELSWILRQHGLRGVISGSQPCGLPSDATELEPLWQALAAASGLLLFIHPHYALGLDALAGYGHSLPVSLGFPFETTVAVARMVFAGVFDRYPRLLVLAAHGGGTLPFLAGRLDAGWRSADRSQLNLARAPSQVLSQIYVDAVVYHRRALQAAVDLVSPEQVLFGTDHPFSISEPAANRSAIEQAEDQASAWAILSGNALRLFGIGTPVSRGGGSGGARPRL